MHNSRSHDAVICVYDAAGAKVFLLYGDANGDQQRELHHFGCDCYARAGGLDLLVVTDEPARGHYYSRRGNPDAFTRVPGTPDIHHRHADGAGDWSSGSSTRTPRSGLALESVQVERFGAGDDPLGVGRHVPHFGSTRSPPTNKSSRRAMTS